MDIWPDSLLIGTKALDFKWLRYGDGYIVNMIAGFHRSPDVMGWHAATVAMLSAILAGTKSGMRRWFWIAIGIIAIAALVLCGRRKMVYMLPLFAVSFSMIYALSGRKKFTFKALFLGIGPLLILVFAGNFLGPDSEYVKYYTDSREGTINQAQKQGFDALIVTYNQSGFFGSGLGVATPGSHNLNVARPRVWQESGPSRVLVELGVPGFLALVGLVFAILKSSWNVVREQQQINASQALYPLGLMAIFVANLGSLGISGQILADPFIAFFLSFMIGVVLSFAREPNGPLGNVRASPRLRRNY